MESDANNSSYSIEKVYPKKSTICITLFACLIGLSSLTFIIFFPVKLLERGPRGAIFIIFNAMWGLIGALLGIFFWIKQGKGKSAAKKYLKVLIICILLGGIYQIGSTYRTRQQYSHIQVAGVERQFLVTIPSSYQQGQAVPLVLALHGGSGNAHQFREDSGFDGVAEKNGFIVVYPDGLGPLKYSIHVWNSGYISTAREMGTDDVSFILALIDYLKSTFTIDANRIYITGHSNGAMMTYRMAAEHPELFAAAAPVAGSIGGKESPESSDYHIPNPSQAISIIHIHGRQDQNVVYDGGYSKSGFQAGVRYDLSANDSVSFWVEKDGCERPAVVSNSRNNKITMEKYLNGKNNTEVVFITLNEQNHFWENLDAEVQAERFNGESLADMIWILMANYNR